MKFWKIGFLTLLVFVSAVVLVLHTSCERNVCDNVTCFNGGSCNQAGTCTCPVGYEGSQCTVVSSSLWVGTYAGFDQCDDNGSHDGYLIDSVQITAGSNVDFVNVAIKLGTNPIQYLSGYISDNAATYSIIVPGDSTSNYIQRFTITLQGTTNLTINTYTYDARVSGDTSISTCYFKGTKDQ